MAHYFRPTSPDCWLYDYQRGIKVRIVPYEDDDNLDQIESLGIIIKAIPFEKGFVPVFTVISPSDDYIMTIDELNVLMDGIEIAHNKIDEIIAFILKGSTLRRMDMQENFDGDDEDDYWEDN